MRLGLVQYGVVGLKLAFKGGGSFVVDFLFIVTVIVGVCNCSIFCLLYVTLCQF